MRTGTKILIGILLVLALLLGAAMGGMLWFMNHYIFLDGEVYPQTAEVLNLRGKEVSLAHYETLRKQYPQAQIYWDVPFQGQRYREDTNSLQIQSLTDEDMQMLRYFPELQKIDASGCREYTKLANLRKMYPDLEVTYTFNIHGTEYPYDTKELTITALTDEDVAMLSGLSQLKTVDAQGCKDYEQLLTLQQNMPELEVSYSVEILGKTYDNTTTELTFASPKVEELAKPLGYLTNLEKVHMTEPEGSPEVLKQLLETYPEVEITWDKTVLGRTFSSAATEYDFSKIPMESTDAVEEAMQYFPNAQKVIMSKCGLDNETMAAFREKMRPEYKVVWTVTVTGLSVRTDDTVFHAMGRKKCLIDEQSYDLVYCEDMIVVDIGHSYVKYIPWVEGMPNLKYLIIADNWIKDITPISSCKNLIYLELFMNKHLKDYSPLLGCTALQDLNLSETYADPTPLAQMTWLKNLWVNNTGITKAERELLSESLPNTNIVFSGYTTGNGWRKLQNYYDMRDIMGLGSNAW